MKRYYITISISFIFLALLFVGLANPEEGNTPESKEEMLFKAILPKYGPGAPSNTYLIGCPLTKESILVDAGDGTDEIMQFLRDHKLKLKYIVLTHGHGDHMIIVGKFSKLEPRPQVLSYGKKGCKHGDLIEVGSLTFEVIHTPGHSEDCLCLYLSKTKMLFTGDSFDPLLSGASFRPEDKSKMVNVLMLPNETNVYSGHGESQPSTLTGRADKSLKEKQLPPIPWTGIQAQPWNSYLLKLEKKKTQEGVFISEVEPDSPSAGAGLQKGDLITKFNSVKVTNPVLFRDMVIKAGIGKEAKLAIAKDKQEQNLMVVIKIDEKK